MSLTGKLLGRGDIRFECLAFDSHGVKAACVRVATPDLTVLIDPGASLQGDGFPLPAAEQESLLRQRLDACFRAASAAKALVISHYHLDHFIESRDPDLYRGKVLFVKDWETLPPKQSNRAKQFLGVIDGLPEEIIPCDGRAFRFGRTTISFSSPVPHGARGAEPGAVVMTTVGRGRETLLHTSDVCGPVEEATADIICAANHRTVILDGYPTHVLGRYETDFDFVSSIINACRILHSKSLRTLVFDHHPCRDYRYKDLCRLIYAKAEKLGKRFGTAAELAGGTSAVLRGYHDNGPTRWKKWQPFDLDQAHRVIERAIAERTAAPRVLKNLDRWVV